MLLVIGVLVFSPYRYVLRSDMTRVSVTVGHPLGDTLHSIVIAAQDKLKEAWPETGKKKLTTIILHSLNLDARFGEWPQDFRAILMALCACTHVYCLSALSTASTMTVMIIPNYGESDDELNLSAVKSALLHVPGIEVIQSS